MKKVILNSSAISTILALFLLVIMIAGLSACQPNPEQQAVVQKGNDTLEEGIKQTASPTDQTEQPDEKWEYQKTYDSGHKLIVDAMLINKNKPNIPVVSIKEKPFESGKQLEDIVKVFYPDAVIYEAGSGYSKSSLEEMIIDYEQELDRVKNGTSKYNFEIPGGYDGSKTYAEQIQGAIDYFKEQYQYASDDSDLKKATYQLEKKGDGSFQSNMKATINDDDFTINFVNWDTPSGSAFLLSDTEAEEPKKLDEFVNPASLYEDETFIQEKNMIDQDVRNMGIDYMDLQNVAKSDIGYNYYYTRTVYGFPETYVSVYIAAGDNEDVYTDLWRPETLYIKTQNGKVTYVKWDNPSEIISIDNENVKILPWEEIQENFLTQMDYILASEPLSKNKDSGSMYREETQITIDRIELGLTKMLMKDSNEYKLIPTWSFLGYANQVKNGVEIGGYTCYMTINAIDGSVVNRREMY